MALMVRSPEAVREQLERIVASESFATASRHSRLLRYLVERTLAGEGEQLKEYVLGTEVFDRADSYDPRIDSIVRVEVRRLRSRLVEYYEGPGADDPLIITIPRGTYVPVFESRSSVIASAPSPEPTAVPPTRTPSPAVAIGLALVVGTLALIAHLLFLGDRVPAAASGKPGVVVLPFQHYSTDQQQMLLAAALTDAVTAEIARRPSVSVTSRTTAAQFTDSEQPLPAIAKALSVDYVVEASALSKGDVVHATVRVVDGRLDRKIWVRDYVVTPHALDRSAREIAQAIVTEITRRHVATPP
jgi:TolB-like protein